MNPLILKIFLSSPGDVTSERALALQVLDQLAYEPAFRGKVVFDIVAWDKPGAGTPMLATMTPQEAINTGLTKPSECDVVIVIFWARMGTPLPFPDYQKEDGTRYLSGTEWEYDDALRAAKATGKPLVLIYRRTEDVPFYPSDPDFDRKIEQWKRVSAFFAGFQNPDGSIRQGYNPYAAPDNFRADFETHLRKLTYELLEQHEAALHRQTPLPSKEVDVQKPLWEGSPFPGLRAFTPEDAPIFFGRGAETDDLVRRLSDPSTRFLAVVAASGAGKSSLVGAGLLPRLMNGAIEGSADWLWVRFTPGESRNGDPFDSMGQALHEKISLSESQVEQLPDNFSGLLNHILKETPEWAELLLFIDQFEELFSLVSPHHVQPFVDFLVSVSETARVRLVITLRADFYANCVEFPQLARLLKTGTYPLAAPGIGALYEMITRPAERAGLRFEADLVQQILSDTGEEPGALALLAFALDELYHGNKDDNVLTFEEYHAVGGVRNAIGERAENTFVRLDAEAQASVESIFQAIVEVDNRGVAIRRRAALGQVASSAGAKRMIEAFTKARLLVQSKDKDNVPVIEVAHEALLRSWTRLATWISEAQHDLRFLRQVRLGAEEWMRNQQTDGYLLTGTRLARTRSAFKLSVLSAEERAYVQRSLEYEKKLEQAEQLRRKREAEIANRAAQFEKRTRQFRRASLFLGMVFLLALLASLFAGYSAIQAQQEGNRASTQIAQADSRISELQNIVPGATQGARWAEWISGYDLETQLQLVATLDSPWTPYVQAFDNVDMVLVPAGCFMMGQYVYGDEAPVHEQCFDEPFWIDQTEVTQADFERLGGQKAEANRFDGENLPVENIDWFEARDYCESRGARLPTEREWEYAARGPDSLTYPWGNEFEEDNAVFNPNQNEIFNLKTSEVGSRSGGVSWVGAFDLSGNVWEWTSSLYEAYPYDPEDGREDDLGDVTFVYRVVRGGSFSYPAVWLLAASRKWHSPDFRAGNVGFRCVRSFSE